MISNTQRQTYLSVTADTNCANPTFHSHPLVLLCELQGCRESKEVRGMKSQIHQKRLKVH